MPPLWERAAFAEGGNTPLPGNCEEYVDRPSRLCDATVGPRVCGRHTASFAHLLKEA